MSNDDKRDFEAWLPRPLERAWVFYWSGINKDHHSPIAIVGGRKSEEAVVEILQAFYLAGCDREGLIETLRSRKLPGDAVPQRGRYPDAWFCGTNPVLWAEKVNDVIASDGRVFWTRREARESIRLAVSVGILPEVELTEFPPDTFG